MEPNNVAQRPEAAQLERSLAELQPGTMSLNEILVLREQGIKQELGEIRQKLISLQNRYLCLLWIGVAILLFGSVALIYLYHNLIKGV